MSATIQTAGLLYPLDRFYAGEGLPLPRATRLEGSNVPAPYRKLLVHERDMTPTLESHYQEPMALEVLHSRLDGQAYSREVVLLGERSRKPVEYGSIQIFLDCFAAAAREEILAHKLPLGTILARHAVGHTSAPRAFFEIASDAVTQKHFNLSIPCLLYGRRNRLTASDGRTLAEIVEILAP